MNQNPLKPSALSLELATMAEIIEELDHREQPYLIIWGDHRQRWFFGLNGDVAAEELLVRLNYMRDKLTEYLDEMEGR